MRIQKVEIKGYRSLRDVCWEPGRLNVIIGPNGSGKSNLLRALGLVKSAAQGKLADDIVRQGGMGPILWDGQTQEISWGLTIEPWERDPHFVHDGGRYEFVLRRLGTTSAYRIEREALTDCHFGVDNQIFERIPGHAIALDKVVPPGSIADDQTLLALMSGPFGEPATLALRDFLAGWSIYHDLHVGQDASLRQAAVTRFEKRLSPDGQNLIQVLHTLYTGDREFRRRVDAAMSAAFGDDYEELAFPPAADQHVQLRLRWRSLKTEQSAQSLSDGTMRFLLLLAILANPDPGDLIAIDEPETGLHPGMLPVVAELAVSAAERTQVLITTHSPELLDAFREDVPTTTVARWEQGETRLAVVDGEELGRWLAHYRLGELFRSGELEGLAE